MANHRSDGRATVRKHRAVGGTHRDHALPTGAVKAGVLGVLAEEVRTMLDDGVAQAPMDIDLAMITGAGFQFWNGGLTPLLDREGVSEKVTGQRFLPKGVASVPA